MFSIQVFTRKILASHNTTVNSMAIPILLTSARKNAYFQFIYRYTYNYFLCYITISLYLAKLANYFTRTDYASLHKAFREI